MMLSLKNLGKWHNTSNSHQRSLRSQVTAVAVATTTLAAPGITTPAQPAATGPIDTAIEANGTSHAINDHEIASCEISCHPWYRFCQSGPYNYKWKDDGHFKFGRYYGGCHRQCFCRCDSL